MTLIPPWWLLFALLVFIGYFVLRTHQHDAWQKVIPPKVLGFLKHQRPGKLTRHPGWLIAAIAFIALSGPSTETQDKDTYRHSQGWIILADVSRSMTLTDVVPSRISAVRDAALDLASHANANSITLIIYAGDAFVITPPSYDTENFTDNANLLEYGLVPTDGSNLTRALSLGLAVIEDSSLIDARLFVLSDTGGFNTNSSAAIARIADLGHRTDLIVFGTEGAEGTGSIDLELAENMANNGNGVVVQSNAIGTINYSKLDLSNRSNDQSVLVQSGLTTLAWSNQSHWLLLLALPLMLILFYRQLR